MVFLKVYNATNKKINYLVEFKFLKSNVLENTTRVFALNGILI